MHPKLDHPSHQLHTAVYKVINYYIETTRFYDRRGEKLSSSIVDYIYDIPTNICVCVCVCVCVLWMCVFVRNQTGKMAEEFHKSPGA